MVMGAGGGWFNSMHHRSHDQGICIGGGGVCIHGGSASKGRGSASRGGRGGQKGLPLGEGFGRPSRDTWDTTGYGQQLGSTHPTGMHSCSFISLSLLSVNIKLNSLWIHLEATPLRVHPNINGSLGYINTDQKRKFLLISAVSQYDEHTEFPNKPFESDVAFGFTQCKCTLRRCRCPLSVNMSNALRRGRKLTNEAMLTEGLM